MHGALISQIFYLVVAWQKQIHSHKDTIQHNPEPIIEMKKSYRSDEAKGVLHIKKVLKW